MQLRSRCSILDTRSFVREPEDHWWEPCKGVPGFFSAETFAKSSPPQHLISDIPPQPLHHSVIPLFHHSILHNPPLIKPNRWLLDQPIEMARNAHGSSHRLIVTECDMNC